ncbi:Hypp7103 [Branchiostoma lanceolatum]|uniref:Hypp7103 protein n=1 Tax=Branchiostoma lanceolatum TaxID=7740 RepID=A0A8J9YXL0_BRALA|nr:Hypp7103 [Branchiostoma lanceolatum]
MVLWLAMGAGPDGIPKVELWTVPFGCDRRGDNKDGTGVETGRLGGPVLVVSRDGCKRKSKNKKNKNKENF